MFHCDIQTKKKRTIMSGGHVCVVATDHELCKLAIGRGDVLEGDKNPGQRWQSLGGDQVAVDY